MRILIHNALAHTPPGTDMVVTTIRENGHVRLAVRDFGEGIKRQSLERIFEPFYSAGDGRAPGLGLAIARELAGAAWTAALSGRGDGRPHHLHARAVSPPA
jgi:signal transduction histidine kinase